MTLRSGIHIESELRHYMAKAQKWDKVVALAKEENQCRARIKAIAQERAKLLGVSEKYRDDEYGR